MREAVPRLKKKQAALASEAQFGLSVRMKRQFHTMNNIAQALISPVFLQNSWFLQIYLIGQAGQVWQNSVFIVCREWMLCHNASLCAR